MGRCRTKNSYGSGRDEFDEGRANNCCHGRSSIYIGLPTFPRLV